MPPLEGSVRRVLQDGFEIDVAETDRFLLGEMRCDGTQVVTGFSTHAKLVRHFARRSTQAIMRETDGRTHVRALLGLVMSDNGSGLLKFSPLTLTNRKPCGCQEK